MSPRSNRYAGNKYGLAAMLLAQHSNDASRPEPHKALSDLALVRATVAAALTETVTDARDAGLSWAAIGEALGVSRQAAWLAYGKTTTPAEEPQVEQLPLEQPRRVHRSR